MIRRILFASSVITSLVAVSFAGPKMEFDTKAFDCGTAIEGVTQKIHATFIVKNPGDSILKLTNVKPSCGCTVVKFDSIVHPGKSAKIEAEVNIQGYHSGPITKYVNVFSNLGGDPTRLEITATIQAAVDASENYIRFDPTNSAPKTINVSSKKADLKVTGITFNVDEATNDNSKKGLKLPVQFKWVATDSVKADGYKVFKLTITPPKFDSSLYGEFIITTNHPDRHELVIRGNLSK